MKTKMLRYWGIALIMIAVMPFLLQAIEDMFIIDFGVYEGRAFKEYESLSTNTNMYRDDGVPRFVLSPSIMALSNWHVVLQSSGKRIKNVVDSDCKKVRSGKWKQDVLGVRISFTETRQNDRAIIKPQFAFHVYDRQGNFANVSNGIVPNIGLIKEVSVWVKGRNYPYDFALRMVDSQNKLNEFYFGNLYFDNWRRLTWVNPNYIDNIKDRLLIRKPLYPKDVPFLRFKSFVVYRHMDQVGGDFIVYIRNCRIVFEKFVEQLIHVDDIDDEKVWKIIQKRVQRKMEKEQRRLAERADTYRKEIKRLGTTKKSGN